MSLVKISEILKAAQEGKYAVTAFDTFNYETINWVINAGRELKTPTIVMLVDEMADYIPAETFAAIVRTLAGRSEYPVGMMLDHGHSFSYAMECLKAGFTSIMVDFSAYGFEENVAMTKEVVKVAHAMGVDVEAELGHVGNAGNLEDFTDDSGYTSPDLAKKFVEMTECDVLAIAFGSAHGNYVKEPKLDMDRLDAIRKVVDIPLVLHGGTGIPDGQIKEAIRRGICKLNVGTGYDQAVYHGLKYNMDNEITGPFIYSALKGVNNQAVEFLKEKITLTRF